MATQLAARPSTPSVRFTAFVVATTAMAASGTIAQPRSTIPANGRSWVEAPTACSPKPTATPTTAWRTSFWRTPQSERAEAADVGEVVEESDQGAPDQRVGDHEPGLAAVGDEPHRDRDDAEEQPAHGGGARLGRWVDGLYACTMLAGPGAGQDVSRIG